MRRSCSFAFALLALCSLTIAQTSEQDTHDKEWAERHQQYLTEPTIKETTSVLQITANDPRPLDNVLGTLIRQHGWHINYEDPLYAQGDLVDNTAPSWLQEHPNGRRVHAVAGGAFSADIPIDGHFPVDATEVLPALVDAYNRSGNPGQFQLRVIGNDSFDIIPIASGDGPQTALLDTPMSFDATDASASETLDRFCKELSVRSGDTVAFGGTFSISSNSLFQARITQHSRNQRAREILRQMYEQIGATDCWDMFYEPDANKFFLLIRFAW